MLCRLGGRGLLEPQKLLKKLRKTTSSSHRSLKLNFFKSASQTYGNVEHWKTLHDEMILSIFCLKEKPVVAFRWPL